MRVLVVPPGERGLRNATMDPVQSPVLERALQSGERVVRLARQDAASLGLPARLAVGGIHRANTPNGWSVIVLSSAAKERDREIRAQWRLLISILVASGIVFAFGGIALREQRKELALATELALASAREQRQTTLLRADKLATLGAFATGITHVIATPLGVIAGRAEQLKRTCDGDPKAAKSVAAILTEAERIQQIIRSFLSMARGQAPALEHVEPAALLEEARHMVEHRFRKSKVSLDVELEGVHARLASDPRLMAQVFTNLLLNACDASRPGGRVTIRARESDGRLEVFVEDEGVGISEEAARRATEPFFTTKPADRGTGLGLAIAHEIVKHHQGTLRIGPRSPLPGTVAVVSLPLIPPAGERS
jgi:signal transduction histidine kinase